MSAEAPASASAEPRVPTPEVTVLDSAALPADPIGLEALRSGVAGADLAAPAVALPDFHFKGDKEMPSSIAIATRDTIRPVYTSSSLNCGMTLVALDIDRPGAPAITDFYDRVRERLPYPPSYRRDLTAAEVIRAATEGAAFAVDRFGADPAGLSRIEEGGQLDAEPYGGAARVRREIPWSVKQLSRIRFASIGPSNHFLEFQQVEEVFDPAAAALLGVEEGQVTLQFHGGGGALPGELGLLFGRRKRFPKPVRIQMGIQKPIYHLARARTADELKLRRRLYFSDGFPPVEREGLEGERLMLSTVMAMNYGFAFRMAIHAIVSGIVGETFGTTRSRLVVDSPHNSIYEETVAGTRAIVHRHNAARAFPPSRMADHPLFGKIGQPLLLPGTNRTSSYLCVAAEGAAHSLFSASHGAGANIKQFAATGISQADPLGRTTLRFDYKSREGVKVVHLDDRGVDEAVGVLAGHEILRPVARMRPFAVLN